MDDVDTHPSSQTLELHRLNLAGDAVHVFEGSLCFNDWDDHQIEGQTIFPATGHLWFFANVMSQLKSSGVLRDVRFLNPLSIPKTGAELQIHSAQERSGLRQIHLYDKTHETWRLSRQASAEELDASDEISPSHVWSYDRELMPRSFQWRTFIRPLHNVGFNTALDFDVFQTFDATRISSCSS